MKELLMVRSKAPQVCAGDCFIKAGDANTRVWEVVAVGKAVDGIEHARLQSLQGRVEKITIGSGVLRDLRFWHRAHVT